MNQAQQRQQQQQELREKERFAEDVRMMSNCRLWPKFGVLPVVERHSPFHEMRCGVMQVWDKEEPVVYISNLVALAGTRVKLSDLSRMEFDSFEACARFWRVD